MDANSYRTQGTSSADAHAAGSTAMVQCGCGVQLRYRLGLGTLRLFCPRCHRQQLVNSGRLLGSAVPAPSRDLQHGERDEVRFVDVSRGVSDEIAFLDPDEDRAIIEIAESPECAACKHPLAVANLVQCDKCYEVFHSRCWADRGRCPRPRCAFPSRTPVSSLDQAETRYRNWFLRRHGKQPEAFVEPPEPQHRIKCPVCGEAPTGDLARCPRCETPHHSDCWDYQGGCAVYACGSNIHRTESAIAYEADSQEAAGEYAGNPVPYSGQPSRGDYCVRCQRGWPRSGGRCPNCQTPLGIAN